MNPGEKMYNFALKIFPYTRSITGEGVRQTLKDIQSELAEENIENKLTIRDIPSGTKAFDWTVPKEWKINSAYIADESGNHIIDMKNNNLHVMGYSTPVDKWVDLEELKKHVFTQPDQPSVIPYVTSYYKERYGFCMSQNQLDSLSKGNYHMFIDSELFNGSLTYAELILPGKTEKEVFFSTYFCHPSMADNECSGPALATELIKYVNSIHNRRYTYRFIFIPETIGSITYMSQQNHLKYMKEHIIAGFNLSCVGDDRDYSIVESKYSDTLADKVLKNVLNFKTKGKYSCYSFLKRGSDERQYNAPGIELPVVNFSRSKYEEYPEYHTSADNMNLVSPSGFQGSYDVMMQVIQALENNYYYRINVLGEPQLGMRGLYPTISQKGDKSERKTMMDFIAYSDCKNDLIDISNIINQPVNKIIPIISKLKKAGLLECEER